VAVAGEGRTKENGTQAESTVVASGTECGVRCAVYTVVESRAAAYTLVRYTL